MEKQQKDLPSSFKRLVAKTTGDTFQQVSEIVERPLDPPSEEQVWRKCRDHLRHHLCAGAVTLSSSLLALSGSALFAVQVVVKVHYAGVNGGCETFRARGEWAFARNRDASEFALGAEGSGTVVATGAQVPDLKVRPRSRW